MHTLVVRAVSDERILKGIPECYASVKGRYDIFLVKREHKWSLVPPHVEKPKCDKKVAWFFCKPGDLSRVQRYPLTKGITYPEDPNHVPSYGTIEWCFLYFPRGISWDRRLTVESTNRRTFTSIS